MMLSSARSMTRRRLLATACTATGPAAVPCHHQPHHPPQPHSSQPQQPPQRSITTFHQTPIAQFPMKPGTTLDGLGIYKEQDAPVVLERSEYPEWLGELVTRPPQTLGQLKRLPQEEATLQDMQRYIKLERKVAIKEYNDEHRKS